MMITMRTKKARLYDDFLEEDADIVDPRMEKVVLIGTIVVAIVLVVIY